MCGLWQEVEAEAAAARAAAAAAQAAREAAIDAALVAAGQPVFANLGNLRWEAGVTQTMEPEQVRAQRTATGAVGGGCGEGGGGGTGLGLDVNEGMGSWGAQYIVGPRFLVTWKVGSCVCLVACSCFGVQVVARVLNAVEAAAARAAAAAARAAHLAAIDAALVAAGHPVFANLGNLRWQAGVNDTMEPDDVRDHCDCEGGVCVGGRAGVWAVEVWGVGL